MTQNIFDNLHLRVNAKVFIYLILFMKEFLYYKFYFISFNKTIDIIFYFEYKFIIYYLLVV